MSHAERAIALNWAIGFLSALLFVVAARAWREEGSAFQRYLDRIQGYSEEEMGQWDEGSGRSC